MAARSNSSSGKSALTFIPNPPSPEKETAGDQPAFGDHDLLNYQQQLLKLEGEDYGGSEGVGPRWPAPELNYRPVDDGDSMDLELSREVGNIYSIREEHGVIGQELQRLQSEKQAGADRDPSR